MNQPDQSHYFDAYLDRIKREERLATLRLWGWRIAGTLLVLLFWGLLLYALLYPDNIRSTGTFPF